MGNSEPYDKKIAAEAGVWLARLQADNRNHDDEQSFQRWLAEDAAHAAAFEDITNVWDRLGAIPEEKFRVEPTKTPIVTRRAILSGAGGFLIAGGVGALFWSNQAQAYQTVVGEQRHIPLKDGTELLLDTNTKVVVDLHSNPRKMDLLYGRINCRVSLADRPFVVRATDRAIIANQDTFDVSKVGNNFSVLLIKGRAQVQDYNGAAITLREGDRVVAAASKPLVRDRPRMSSLMAWQTGRIVFENETVANAVAQMNRYSAIALEIDDPDISQYRLSGGYLIGNNFSFAESLSHILPIEVRQSDGKIKLIRKSGY